MAVSIATLVSLVSKPPPLLTFLVRSNQNSPDPVSLPLGFAVSNRICNFMFLNFVDLDQILFFVRSCYGSDISFEVFVFGDF